MLSHVMLCALLAAAAAVTAAAPTPSPAAFRLAKVFSDGMVLQRDTEATSVWGFAPANAVVQPELNKMTLPAVVADSSGSWTVRLPRQPAGGPHELAFSSGGKHVNLTDVLFGDVILCGGQSNAVFSVPGLINASAEVALAGNPAYRSIRIMTVGDLPKKAAPQADLHSVLQPWTPVNSSSISHGGAFGEFSAYCWLTGRGVFDGLNRTVPLGLIASASSGTPIEAWMSDAMLSRCPQSPNDPYKDQNAGLWNGQIAPFASPESNRSMALSSIIWWQGEANAAFNQTDFYSCAFPVLVEHWRDAFCGASSRNAIAFGFVHLQAFYKYSVPQHNDTTSVAWFREAQLAALKLPNVTAATAIDLGDPLSPAGSIHIRDKQAAGARLAAGLLALRYGVADAPYVSPRATGTSCSTVIGGGLKAVVTLDAAAAAAAGGLQLLDGPTCPTSLNVNVSECSWFGLLGSDGLWRNATATLAPGGGASVTLTAAARTGITPIASGYAWSIYPVATLATHHGPGGWPLPVLPWLINC